MQAAVFKAKYVWDMGIVCHQSCAHVHRRHYTNSFLIVHLTSFKAEEVAVQQQGIWG